MSDRAASHTNRMGVTFYLHAGETKTGKTRYFAAKTIGKGALPAMPDGYEFTESINGVVSVRRSPSGEPAVPPHDLELARAELSRHRHLASHRADVVKGEIVVFEPSGAFDPASIAEIEALFGVGFGTSAASALRLKRRIRYAPVMKFVPFGDGNYAAHRMTYRGDGGWSWPLASGPLSKILAGHIRHIGTDRFFELM